MEVTFKDIHGCASVSSPPVTPLPRPDLDRIAAYCEAAPLGPWVGRIEDWDETVGTARYPGGACPLFVQHNPEVPGMDAARAFVVQARTDLPAVVAYLRHVESTLADTMRDLDALPDRLAGQVREVWDRTVAGHVRTNEALAAENGRLRAEVQWQQSVVEGRVGH